MSIPTPILVDVAQHIGNCTSNRPSVFSPKSGARVAMPASEIPNFLRQVNLLSRNLQQESVWLKDRLVGTIEM